MHQLTFAFMCLGEIIAVASVTPVCVCVCVCVCARLREAHVICHLA